MTIKLARGWEKVNEDPPQFRRKIGSPPYLFKLDVWPREQGGWYFGLQDRPADKRVCNTADDAMRMAEVVLEMKLLDVIQDLAKR